MPKNLRFRRIHLRVVCKLSHYAGRSRSSCPVKPSQWFQKRKRVDTQRMAWHDVPKARGPPMRRPAGDPRSARLDANTHFAVARPGQGRLAGLDTARLCVSRHRAVCSTWNLTRHRAPPFARFLSGNIISAFNLLPYSGALHDSRRTSLQPNIHFLRRHCQNFAFHAIITSHNWPRLRRSSQETL